MENNLVLPRGYDLIHTVPSKNDEELNSFRKEFFNIYNNLFCLKPLKEYILTSILDKFEKIADGNCDIKVVELSLFLINLNINFQDTSNFPQIQSIFSLLYKINFSNFQSRFVLLTYFETSFKYIQHKINDNQVLENLIRSYFSDVGILNQDLNYSVQVSTIFNKLIEKLKGTLNLELTEFIIGSLRQYFEHILSLNNFYLICENAVNFNSFSVAINIRSVNDDLKFKMFGFILNFFNNVIQIHGIDEDKFNELAKIITNFLKSIGYEVSKHHKSIFIEFFNNFINTCYLSLIHSLNNKNSAKTKYALITILQRLIVVLGSDSINFLSFFFSEQIRLNDPEIYEDTIKLLSNATQILKKESHGLISEYLFYFVALMKNYHIPKSNISEIEKNIISLYANFVKLVANITIELPEIFFMQTIKNFDFDYLVNLLYLIAYEIVDPTVRKDLYY